MAGSVTSTRAGVYNDTPNKVRAVTDVRMVAVKYTGSNGKEEDALALLFGKAEDGRPGVFVLIDGSDRMREHVKVASKHIREGVLKALEEADTKQVLAAGVSADDAALGALGG